MAWIISLQGSNQSIISFVQALRWPMNLDLRSAKCLVDQARAGCLSIRDDDLALEVASRLERAGGIVELKRAS